MPSRCALHGCKKPAALQAKLPGDVAAQKWRYYCSMAHLETAGAIHSEANKKQRAASLHKAQNKGMAHLCPLPHRPFQLFAHAPMQRCCTGANVWAGLPVLCPTCPYSCSPRFADRASVGIRIAEAITHCADPPLAQTSPIMSHRDAEPRRPVKGLSTSPDAAAGLRQRCPPVTGDDTSARRKKGKEEARRECAAAAAEASNGRGGDAEKDDAARLRKRSKAVDYSLLNGKWGFGAVHSRSAQEEELKVKVKKKKRQSVHAHAKTADGAAGACHGESAGGPRSSAAAATALRCKIKNKLSRARYLESMLDAYQQEGWGGRGHRQLKPTAELAKCSQQLVQVKTSIRALLEALDPDPKVSQLASHDRRIPEKAYQHDGVHVDNVRPRNLIVC